MQTGRVGREPVFCGLVQMWPRSYALRALPRHQLLPLPAPTRGRLRDEERHTSPTGRCFRTVVLSLSVKTPPLDTPTR